MSTTHPDTVSPDKEEANRDPITGEPGSHPVGTGLGATSGGLAGAAIGAFGGPVGAAIGAAAGAIVGGLAGKGVAEAIDPTVEDSYWRENYAGKEYVETGAPYEDYQPAYRTGYEGVSRYPGIPYYDAEENLRRDYEENRGTSNLTWDRARQATRDAWHRVEKKLPGDADGDGR